MRNKTTAKDVAAIIFGCCFALVMAAVIVIPILIKLELAESAINYMDRH